MRTVRIVLGALFLSSVLHGRNDLSTFRNQLIKNLINIDVVQFGDFVLKSGIHSPIYFDCRRIISVPHVLHQVAEQMFVELDLSTVDCICGVPYGALPVATALSLISKKPLIMQRKEIKKYGTQKRIEGIYKKGMRCLVVEDCFTTGGSAIETIEILEQEGFVVDQVVVIIDRQQGGKEYVESRGYKVTSLYTLSDILDVAELQKLVSFDDFATVKEFVRRVKANVSKK